MFETKKSPQTGDQWARKAGFSAMSRQQGESRPFPEPKERGLLFATYYPPNPPIVSDDVGGNFTPLFGELLDWLLYFARLTREVFIGWDISHFQLPR